jgi:AcrR family transcriptional regulator
MSPRNYDMSTRSAAVEQTKRRIVEATRDLHNEQGIAATSWDDIARRAGVGVGTVYRHFPTLDELVPACGQVALGVIAMPDPDAAPALFEGAGDAHERILRLVSEIFAMYERGASDMGTMLRDLDVHPMVGEAAGRLEAVLAAFVEAALEPLGADAADRRVARALIDFRTWRALRDQGLSTDAAIEAVADLLACRSPAG